MFKTMIYTQQYNIESPANSNSYNWVNWLSFGRTASRNVTIDCFATRFGVFMWYLNRFGDGHKNQHTHEILQVWKHEAWA